MQLYKDYVDPDFVWSNFTVEEQAKVIVAPRSNNLLDTARIESEFPQILPIKESLIKYVFEPAAADKEAVLKAVKEMRGERGWEGTMDPGGVWHGAKSKLWGGLVA